MRSSDQCHPVMACGICQRRREPQGVGDIDMKVASADGSVEINQTTRLLGRMRCTVRSNDARSCLCTSNIACR